MCSRALHTHGNMGRQGGSGTQPKGWVFCCVGECARWCTKAPPRGERGARKYAGHQYHVTIRKVTERSGQGLRIMTVLASELLHSRSSLCWLVRNTRSKGRVFIGASAFAGAFSFLEERMSEQPKRYEQALVDALVAGDPAGLGTALRWLSKTDAGRFLAVTKQLLDTKREKKLSAVLLRRQFRLRSGLCRL